MGAERSESIPSKAKYDCAGGELRSNKAKENEAKRVIYSGAKGLKASRAK